LQWDESRVRLRLLLDLLDDIMSEPLFDELRTKQQLGYSVSCSVRDSHGVLGFSIHVLSAVQRPPVLLQRIEAFIANFSSHIRSLGADKFSSHVASLASRWLEPIRTLYALQSACWTEILSGYPVFDRSERDAAILGTVTQSELCEFFDTYLSANALARACVVTAVVPPMPQGSDNLAGDGADINALETEERKLRDNVDGYNRKVSCVRDEQEFQASAQMHEPRS